MVCIGLLILLFTVYATLWMLSLKDPDKLAYFQNAIAAMGIRGWLVLLLIQYIQIVVAFIPGGPIQVIAGVLFGPLWGTVVCFAGAILASFTIFFLVSRFGKPVIKLFVADGDLDKYTFLQNAEKIESLAFILFFIPGTPKDALTYLFALTPIKASRFVIVTTAARLPAVFTSVLMGNSLIHGQWLASIVIFIVLGVLSAGGLLLHKKLLQRVSSPHSIKEKGELKENPPEK